MDLISPAKSPLYPLWKEFTKTGKLSKIHNPIIYSSWKRCLEHDIRPFDMQISQKLPEKQKNALLENNAMLLKASIPNLTILENTFMKMSYALLLCDGRGDIIYKSGKGLVSKFFDEANLVVGGNCSETVIGTTAPGIALVEKKPAVVIREEHYCEIYHWCCCSAFPVFDIEQNLVGCIDVTTLYDQSDKINFLHGLNIATVKSIQSTLHVQQLLKMMDEAREVLENTSNLTKKNILIINRSGRILLANQSVSDLLGIPVYRLTGEHYWNVLESDAITSCFQKEMCVQAGARLRERHSQVDRYRAQAQPLSNRNGEFFGSLVMLDQAKRQWTAADDVGLEARHSFQTLIGDSPGIKRAIKLASKFAGTDVPILLYGETGTGKEVFAHAIHNESLRGSGPFVPVNCAAIPFGLVESELFGYTKGAFTGAHREGKKGKFETAEGGTLFLDEINSMPLDVQGKLLRAVEYGEIVGLGDHVFKHIDVRIIAASSLDLKEELANGRFRKDLFYRLGIARIFLPPLRDRTEDILSLIHYFLEKFAAENRRKKPMIYSQTLKTLMAYDWPGNIRELENCIRFAMHIADTDEILPEHLPDYLLDVMEEKEAPVGSNRIQDVERAMLLSALESSHGHIGQAAKILGVSRSTVYRRRKQLGLMDMLEDARNTCTG